MYIVRNLEIENDVLSKRKHSLNTFSEFDRVRVVDYLYYRRLTLVYTMIREECSNFREKYFFPRRSRIIYANFDRFKTADARSI